MEEIHIVETVSHGKCAQITRIFIRVVSFVITVKFSIIFIPIRLFLKLKVRSSADEKQKQVRSRKQNEVIIHSMQFICTIFLLFLTFNDEFIIISMKKNLDKQVVLGS